MPWLWRSGEKRGDKTEQAARLIEDLEAALRRAQDRPPAYTVVHTYNEDDPAYLRNMAEIVDNPCYRFFMTDCREFVLNAMREAPPEERPAMIGALQGLEIVLTRGHLLRGKYHAASAAEAGNEQEGEV